MKIEQPLAFVFEDRDDVIHELLHGSHAGNMRAHECPSCGRFHVLITSQMFTPFSGKQRLPPGVEMDVEVDWMNGHSREDVPQCSACGVAMVPVRKHSTGK